MKRKVFNRIVCLLTTITMLATPFASLADDLPPQDGGIELVENEASESGEEDAKIQTDPENEADYNEGEELIFGEDIDEDADSPVLDMDDQSLDVTNSFIGDDDITSIKGDVETQEGDEIPSVQSNTIQNIELSAGEEEFPDNSRSISVEAGNTSLDAGELDQSEFDGCEETMIGEIKVIGNETTNAELAAAKTTISLSPSSLMISRGNTGTVNVYINNLTVDALLYCKVIGEDRVATTWGNLDTSNGIRLPLYIKGLKNGVADIGLELRNRQTDSLICFAFLHVVVNDGPKIVSSAYTVNIKQGQSFKATFTISGVAETVYLQYGNNNTNAIRCTWGDWFNNYTSIPMTITGMAPGSGTVTVYLKRASNGETLASTNVKVNISANARISASVQNVSLLTGETSSININFSNVVTPSYLMCTTTNNSAYSLTWGSQSGSAVALNIRGLSAGSGTVHVYLKACANDETLATTSFTVNVSKANMSFTSKDISLTAGEEKSVTITISGVSGMVYISTGVANEAVCSTAWGSASNASVNLKIKGLNAGTTHINVYLKDESGKLLCSDSIKVTVVKKNNPQVTVGKSSVEISTGNSAVVPITAIDVNCRRFKFSADNGGSTYFSCKWGDWSGNTNNLTITGKAQGTGIVKIHLINADTNETLASNQISVTVKGTGEVALGDISYYFPNFRGSASEYVCRYMFSDATWEAVQKLGLGNNGNCYGMSTTAGMFYVPSNGVDVSSFSPNENRIGKLERGDWSSDYRLTVQDFIQAMQISQASSECNKILVTDFDKLIQNINNEVKNGRLVELSIFGEWYEGKCAGHSILAYGTQRISSTNTRVLVYDCNDPNAYRYLTISKDSNGNYSWLYGMNSDFVWGTGHKYAKILYMNYSGYMNLWSHRDSLVTNNTNLLAVNSQDFTLYDVYDYPVAVMENGELITEDESIYKVDFVGVTLDGDQSGSGYSLIHMPVDLYTIKNTDKSIDELDLTFTNLEYGVEVTTKADEVMLCADDKCDLAAAMINDCDQKDYSITLMKSDDEGELQTVEISGTGNDDAVSAALDSGNLETSNVDGSTIVISDGAGFEKLVSDITLDKYYKEIIEGDKFTINAIVTPFDAVDAQIKWSSSDETVAKVDQSGCVEALSAGYATITAKAGNIESSCSVNVIEKGSQRLPSDPVLINSISFNEAEVSLKPGQSKQLDVTINPEDATNKKLTWTSSNESVVTVSDNGVITAVADGQVTITVTAQDDGKAKANCTVTVSSKASGGGATDPQPYIDETTTELTLVKGQKFVLSEKDWKSSDNKVVNVKNGKVTVKKDGKAELSRDGQTINVTVLAPSFDAKSVKMISGQEKSIVLNNTGDLEVLYLSNAPDVAAVSEDGEVTALSKGSAVINAYVNGVVYKYTVKVADVDTSKRDFSKTVELVPMQTVSIKIQGFNAKKAVWSSASQVSENEIPKGYVFADSVVKISRSGKLTAIGSGETTLTATGGSDTPVTISIVVSEPVEKTLHLNLKSSKTLKMYGVKGYLDWNIEDNTIVEVSKNKVTPKAAGSTELTAQYEGFSYKVTVYVEDIALATDDRLTGKSNKYSVSMKTGDTIELLPVKLYQPMIFKSNKSEVAYADEDGLLTARSAGTARLTAKVNGKTVTVTVKVTD